MNARPIVAFAALAALAPSDAHAWDSDCGGCEAGPPASTAPWTGPSIPQADPDDPHNDEHGELLALAMKEWAFLPDALLAPIDLTVYTAADGSIVGAPLLEATSVTHHQRRISEFALLPDQGFALWDWALGFEQCPVDVPFLSSRCHEFVGYGGVLNANHFLPQAESNYGHYHRLALDIAGHCREMADALNGDPDGMEFVLQCEQQALVVETVGQHFLQDAWSSGHMWSRWGGPDLGDLPSVQAGAIVAAVAGLVHGSRSITGMHDLMSAPDPTGNIQYRENNMDGMVWEMVGDLYLADLLGSATYSVQRTSLFECSSSGLLEVYRAAGANHSGGDADAPVVDPTSEQCFGQRATNRALFRGFDDIELAQIVVVILDFAGNLIDAQPAPTAPSSLQYELAMMRLKLEVAAHDTPFETNMAAGDIGPLQGVGINNDFLRSPPASYSDDDFGDWRASASGTADRTTALTRIFHRGNAVQWCDALESGDLDALRMRSIEGGEDGHVATEVCVEFARRHIEYKEEEDEEVEGEQEADELLPTPRICDASDEPSEEEAQEENQEEEEGEEEEEEEEEPKSLCRRIASGSAPIIRIERLENGPEESAYDMAVRWCLEEPEEDEEEGVPPDIGYPQDECEPADEAGDPARPTPGNGWGSGIGDPHMRSFDGLGYDLHAGGEYVLVTNPSGLFEVQIRTRRADNTPFACDNVAVISGVALRLGAHRFTVQDASGTFVPRLDGEIVALGTRVLADGSVLTVQAEQWYVTRPDGAAVLARTTNNWMHVYVTPATADRGVVRGLLGDADGALGDDFRNASGTVIGSLDAEGTPQITTQQLSGNFIETWQVTAASSLFDYGPGETPQTFIRPWFGSSPMPYVCGGAAWVTARNTCLARGVPEAWATACALDVATGGEELVEGFEHVAPVTWPKYPPVCIPGTCPAPASAPTSP